MLARLQQVSTILLVALAIAWALHFIGAGQPTLAGVGALAILLSYAAFLAAEFILLTLVRQRDPAPPASATQLLRAWWGEVLTAPRVFCWRQPFRSNAEPDHVPPSTTGRRGVVFVHGFVCNRALWNPWMARLRVLQVPFAAVNLEPVFGTIDNYVAIIDAAAARLEAATGLAPVLVAHSMGGLAVRAWLSQIADDARAHHIITIGTPHHGTWLARFGRTTNGQQMRLGNPWLQHLQSQEHPARLRKFTCIYSHCDNIVFPPTTATLPHATNLHIPGTAHVHLAFQGAAYAELLRWVMPQPLDQNGKWPSELIDSPHGAARQPATPRTERTTSAVN